MSKSRPKRQESKSWIWLCSLIGVFFVFIIVCYAGRSLRTNGAQNGSLSPPPEIKLTKFSPPTLRSLIINPDSEDNYFDFILDIADSPVIAKSPSQNVSGEEAISRHEAIASAVAQPGSDDLEDIAKDLIHYFFLGITLPSSDFWVNLNSVRQNEITNERLARTDIGKVLLAADLQLKKDTCRFTDPRHPLGKEYWNKLQKELYERGLSRAQLPIGNRLWIIPDQAVVEEDGTKVTIVKSRLKVCLEQEYLALQNNTVSLLSVQNEQERQVQDITGMVMRQVILSKIEDEVNYGQNYAPLRQVYNSLILAEYFKQKYWNKQSLYSQYVNRGYLSGLESKPPWEKQNFFNAYAKSCQEGEYALSQSEYDPYQMAMVQKYYFYGGILFEELTRILNTIKKSSSSPAQASSDLSQDNLILAKLTNQRPKDEFFMEDGVRLRPTASQIANRDTPGWRAGFAGLAGGRDGGQAGQNRDAEQSPIPPSGIKEVFLNGEEVGTKVVQEEIAKLSNGGYIFNALIKADALSLGTAPAVVRGEKVTHDRLSYPPPSEETLRGFIMLPPDGFSLLLPISLDYSSLELKDRRRIHDRNIMIARFFIEHGFHSSFEINWQTLQQYDEAKLLFDVNPQTLGELARQPLFSEKLRQGGFAGPNRDKVKGNISAEEVFRQITEDKNRILAARMMDRLINEGDNALFVGVENEEAHPVACAIRKGAADIAQPDYYALAINQHEELNRAISETRDKIKELCGRDMIGNRIDTERYRDYVEKTNLPLNHYSHIFLLRVLDDDYTNPDKKAVIQRVLSAAQDNSTILVSSLLGFDIEEIVNFLQLYAEELGYEVKRDRIFEGEAAVYELKVRRLRQGGFAGISGGQDEAKQFLDELTIKEIVKGVVREGFLQPGLKVIKDDEVFEELTTIYKKYVSQRGTMRGMYFNRERDQQAIEEVEKRKYNEVFQFLDRKYGKYFNRVIVLPSDPKVTHVRHEILHDVFEISSKTNKDTFGPLSNFMFNLSKYDPQFGLAYLNITKGNLEIAKNILWYREVMLCGFVASFFSGELLESLDYLYVRETMPEEGKKLFYDLGFIWPSSEDGGDEQAPGPKTGPGGIDLKKIELKGERGAGSSAKSQGGFAGISRDKETWRGIPVKEVKTLLYPACGRDDYTVRKMLEQFPSIEDVYLVDDVRQDSVSVAKILRIMRIGLEGYLGFSLISRSNNIRALDNLAVEEPAEREKYFLLTFKSRTKVRTVRVHLHKRDYLALDKIRGLAGGADLIVVRSPGVNAELTTIKQNNTPFYRIVHNHTRPGGYVYITKAQCPLEEAMRESLEIIDASESGAQWKNFRDDFYLHRTEGRILKSWIPEDGYLVCKKINPKGENGAGESAEALPRQGQEAPKPASSPSKNKSGFSGLGGIDLRRIEIEGSEK